MIPRLKNLHVIYACFYEFTTYFLKINYILLRGGC